MRASLVHLPLLPLLTLAGGAAMLVPAAQAAALGLWRLAAIFAGSAGAVLLGAGMVALALAARPPRAGPEGRTGLAGLVLTLVLLPAALAVPVAAALPDTGLLNAWWEMLSCLTTTGASLYDPARLAAPMHLWRGMVGWGGGLLTLAAAVAILAPLQVGGFELTARPRAALRGGDAQAGPAARLARAVRALLPLYGGATLVLWGLLAIAGDAGLGGLMRAMGTVSTSGIAAGGAPRGGVLAEAAVAAGMILALSRRFWPGGEALRTTRALRGDPELRLAALAVAGVALALLVRALLVPGGLDALAVLWGAGFTALSYLTTTGWTAGAWGAAGTQAALAEPGLILAGLALLGGGAATAAGGVKLLRIAALLRHGGDEMARIVHPSAVAGGGADWRQLRAGGAFLAFLTFMLMALAIASVMLLVTLSQVPFDTATVLSIAALTNTGPLMGAVAVSPALGGGAGIAGAPWDGWAGLPAMTKAILAAAMVAGRVEILAVLALLSPATWRR